MHPLPKLHPHVPHYVFWIGLVLIALSWLFLTWQGRVLLHRGNSFALRVDPEVAIDDGRLDVVRFSSAIDQINQSFALPEQLDIHVEFCGEPNAYYDMETREVIVCDELIDDFQQIFSAVYPGDTDLIREATTNALLFITFHEMGHGLFHILGLPITGREEDVADQLSVYVLTQSNLQSGDAVLDGATWFGVTSETYQLEESDFSDEHSLDAQRYYNLACWVYGSNPAEYRQVVLDGGLTPERLDICIEEFELLRSSWDTLLEPYTI